jgi:acyl carrier protein
MKSASPTPTCEGLRAIWCELLGLDQVGDHESFFALGGRSMDAIRLVNRIQSTFGLEITVRTVFEAQTVSQLSEALQGLTAAPDRPRLAAGRRSG